MTGRWVINRFLKKWLDHCHAERAKWHQRWVDSGRRDDEALRARDRWDDNIIATEMQLDYLWE